MGSGALTNSTQIISNHSDNWLSLLVIRELNRLKLGQIDHYLSYISRFLSISAVFRFLPLLDCEEKGGGKHIGEEVEYCGKAGFDQGGRADGGEDLPCWVFYNYI